MVTNTDGAASANKPLVFLRLVEVKRRVGLSRSEIYRKVRVGEFPKPVKLSLHASAWAEHEIEAWCLERLESRGAP